MRREQTIRLMWIFFLYNLLLVGVYLNLGVQLLNGGKMPVLISADVELEGRHFAFQEKDEVERYYLTDIIPLGAPLGKTIKWSIGDFFVVISSVSIIIYGGTSSYDEIREWVEIRKQKEKI
mgnify:CR=1 FL=1